MDWQIAYTLGIVLLALAAMIRQLAAPDVVLMGALFALAAVGILTSRDCKFQTSADTPVAQLMTGEDLVTAPPGTSLDDARELLHERKVEKLLIVDADMHGCPAEAV